MAVLQKNAFVSEFKFPYERPLTPFSNGFLTIPVVGPTFVKQLMGEATKFMAGTVMRVSIA